MTDLPKNEWMNQWQALSRRYWNAWQDLAREAGSPAGDTATPWHEGFEQWARMFAGPGKQSETIERVLASAKGFTAFVQSMIAAATAGGGTTPSWAEALRNGFQMPGGAGSPFANPVAEALREVSGRGAKSFEQMMEGLAPALDPMRELKGWLHAPTFGYLREHQEHYQKMALALVDYQEQNGRYNALILKASQRGFELFESKLAAHEEPGRQIDSVRALYDLWVDAAEEAYAEIALSPEFREVYGALVNAQMRVRSQIQQEVERIATDFGMPTRSELDSIGQRLHDLRRELRNGSGSGTSGLAQEVERLRKEVAALKAAIGEGAVSARVSGAPAAAPARPAQRKRAPRPASKKLPRQVAALRADVGEAVSAPPGEARRPPRKPGGASTPRARPQTRALRPSPPSRAKNAKRKSVAKIAHRPTRVGHPVASFAERMAAFARTARAGKRATGPTVHGTVRSNSRAGGR